VETGTKALQFNYLVVLNRMMTSYLRHIKRQDCLDETR